MKSTQKVGGAGKGPSVADQLGVPSGSSGSRLGTVASEELGNELVARHPDQPVDGVHGNPLTGISKRPRPRQGMKIVCINQRAVDIKEHSGTQQRGHWAPPETE
jgi:hypothetical protein